MDKQQKEKNGRMAFPDAIMEDTVNLLAILARMPRAEPDNAATNNNAAANESAGTNAVEIAPASDEQEQPSFLNQLALQEGLHGIEQEAAGEEVLNRIEKMKLLDFDMKQYAIDNDGRQPGTQEMVAMMANAGLSVDDIKSIAWAQGSGITKQQFGSWESNETEN